MKKLILTTALFLTLAGAAFSVSTNAQEQQPISEQVVVINEEVNLESPENATDPEAGTANIQESEISRKMTQAEKAHNAAVNDSWGGAITIIAMCIVIGALIVLSLLFLGFGKISQSLMSSAKKKAKKAAAHVDHEDHLDLDSGEVIAAIAMALSEHFAEGHDVEDTILTIRRLQKAYSPWNSKIYNLRNLPEHERHNSKIAPGEML